MIRYCSLFNGVVCILDVTVFTLTWSVNNELERF